MEIRAQTNVGTKFGAVASGPWPQKIFSPHSPSRVYPHGRNYFFRTALERYQNAFVNFSKYKQILYFENFLILWKIFFFEFWKNNYYSETRAIIRRHPQRGQIPPNSFSARLIFDANSQFHVFDERWNTLKKNFVKKNSEKTFTPFVPEAHHLILLALYKGMVWVTYEWCNAITPLLYCKELHWWKTVTPRVSHYQVLPPYLAWPRASALQVELGLRIYS